MSPIKPIPTVEQEHPLLWLLYGVAAVLAIAISSLFVGCGGSDDPVDDDPKELIQPPNCAASGACR